MRSRTRWLAALMIGMALPLSACAEVSSTSAKAEPAATVEAIGDTGVSRVTLTERAVERLAIETGVVAEQAITAGRVVSVVKTIPYASLLYQPDGATFVYTNPEPRTYVRETVTVQEIAGDEVVVTAGPATGVAVVTVGAAELWGTEFKIGKY